MSEKIKYKLSIFEFLFDSFLHVGSYYRSLSHSTTNYPPFSFGTLFQFFIFFFYQVKLLQCPPFCCLNFKFWKTWRRKCISMQLPNVPYCFLFYYTRKRSALLTPHIKKKKMPSLTFDTDVFFIGLFASHLRFMEAAWKTREKCFIYCQPLFLPRCAICKSKNGH